uniref:Protein BCP1 n=1 Tax=Coccolithus braarudii TaxID=221442 RepID=A0A7S0LNB5_9EUKA|mmetsp:Transcript_49883/g.106623  ORF Transcript_49883/g.106623 Transcript_49883/m.106623 type:complete len:349 (+) Transcript_49883:1-1047(+)
MSSLTARSRHGGAGVADAPTAVGLDDEEGAREEEGDEDEDEEDEDEEEEEDDDDDDAAADEDDDEDDDDNDDDEDDEDDEDERDEDEDLALAEAEGTDVSATERLNIEFTFFDPRPNDALHIRALLQAGTLSATGVNTLELADYISEQAAVGTLIKADDDVFGFLTALPLQHLRNHACVKPLISLVFDCCSQPAAKQALATLLTGRDSIGLLISERLVNAPLQLVPDLLESLVQDIEWAKENEEEPPLRAAFDFRHLLLVCKVTKAAPGEVSSELPRKKQKKGSAKVIGLGWEELQALHFDRVEEEALAYEAEWCCHLSTPGASLLLALLTPLTVKRMVPKLRAIMCD